MSAAKTSSSTENPAEDIVPRIVEEKKLITWRAPLRVYKKRNKEFWSTVAAMAFLIGLILFFIDEWLLIMVMVSVIFLYYVFSSFPPEEIEYGITNEGLLMAEKKYYWEQMDRFWITEKWGQKILNFGFDTGIVRSLRVMINKDDEGKIKEILKNFLPEEPIPPTWTDKASVWLSNKIPLETS